MKVKLKLFLLTIFLSSVAVQSQFLTRFLNLPLDHFNLTNKRNFDIHFLVNENFYRENGPILIFVNDGPASPQFILGGNMFEVAEKEGGVLISLERRYYGSSLPTPDATYENLQWLTHHQSVADIARFASFIKKEYLNAPVILWGRAHGGSLAIWTRQKYPNVIDGAWASSPRINAVLEASEFIPHGIRMINQIGGAECGQVITDAFNMVEEAFQSGNTSYVEERLFACGPLDVSNGYDLATFNYVFAINIAYFVSQMKYTEFDEICSIMLGTNAPENPPSDPIDAFARWFIDLVVKPRFGCIPNNYETYIQTYQGTSWSDDSTVYFHRQRLWLSCAQHGQFQVANNGQGHPFGTRFDLRFFKRWCIDSFGDLFLDPWWIDDNVHSFNRIYGGMNPGAYRLFLTQGELDPVRTLGPSNDINPLSPVVVIPLQSFSRDVFAPNESEDYAALYQTKLRIQQTIHEWIENAKHIL